MLLIVMEYADGGSLADFMRLTSGESEPRSEDIAIETKLQILLDVAKALQFLHSRMPNPIVHRVSDTVIEHRRERGNG